MAQTEPGPGAATGGHPGLHRPIAVLVLLVAGVLSLPLAALFLDGQDADTWVLPAAFVAMAVFGAVVGSVLPGVAGPHASASKGRWAGALIGVAMVALGTLVFYLLLNGFDGV